MARHAPISQRRSSGSFRRKAGQKPPRAIILIVCEGNTERVYFEAARIHYGLTTAEVIIAENTAGSAPISVVRCAERKCGEAGGYDRVYCVFDRNGHESFARARDQIKALADRKRKPLPIVEAISIPCFELWVLPHHEKTDAPFHRCADVIDRVCHHMPDYQKADEVIARQLMAKLATAFGNADWLEGRAAETGYNPYTSVHRVVRHFAAVAERDRNP